MRWDRLFDDLAAQASAAIGDDALAEVDERARHEIARVPMTSRLAGIGAGAGAGAGSAAEGVIGPLTVDLVDGDRVTGRLTDVGDGWLCIAAAPDELLLPLSSVAGIYWPTTVPGPFAGWTRASLVGLRPVLRALVRRRVYVRLATRGGRTCGGTLDKVGADHVELAEHPADRPRRSVEVRAVQLVPFDALLTVRYASE